MDIQLLIKLAQMTPPRLLSAPAEVAAAKRLVDEGLIDASTSRKVDGKALALRPMKVDSITPKGMLEMQKELARTHSNAPRRTRRTR